MPDLKSSLLSLIQTEHRGKARAITVAQIISELLKWHLSRDVPNERQIRKIIRELNFEGHPVLTSTNAPFGVYYADTREEVNEYLANLGSRMHAILDRMRAVDRTWSKEFLKGQMELFS